MGTRCTIRVKDSLDDNSSYVSIYKQFDGYFSGIGENLKQRFGNHAIVNGFGFGDTDKTTANGMGCLAAQLVAFIKEGIGNVYLENEPSKEYHDYTIYKNEFQGLNICAVYGDNVLYNGPLIDFDTTLDGDF